MRMRRALLNLRPDPRWALSYARHALVNVDRDSHVRFNRRLVLISPASIDRVIDQACNRRVGAIVQPDLLTE